MIWPFFVVLLENLRHQKRHSEINWPLVIISKFKLKLQSWASNKSTFVRQSSMSLFNLAVLLIKTTTDHEHMMDIFQILYRYYHIVCFLEKITEVWKSWNHSAFADIVWPKIPQSFFGGSSQLPKSLGYCWKKAFLPSILLCLCILHIHLPVKGHSCTLL